MEKVVGNGEVLIKENSEVKIGSPSSSGEEIANPVVYKLVRVEGDGSLVPATEDEVMEAENMFEIKNVKESFIADNEQIEGGVLDEPSTAVEAKTVDSEGKLQLENTKADSEKFNARLEYIGVMLQKVKHEEKLRLSSASLNHSSNHMILDGQISDQHDRSSTIEGKLPTEHALQDPLPSSIVKDSRMTRLGSGVTSLKPTVGLLVSGSSPSGSCRSSVPDFSRIKGEICLDNLTVRELQETFRATFGRETTVKDKSWLQRRIAMGLTNSCDVSTTTFIIRDNVLVGKKVKDVKQLSEMAYHICKDSPTSPTVQVVGQQAVSCKRLRKVQPEDDCKSEDVLCLEQSAAKRVRKPTKRYIEESDAETRESGGRSINNSGHGQSSPKFRVMPIHDVTADEAASVSRQDSFGGSGIHVPHVSRVRRARPRENIMPIVVRENVMPIVPHHPSSTKTVVKKALVDRTSQQDSESEETKWKDINAPKHIQPQECQPQVVDKTNQEKENVVKCFSETKESVKYEKLDSFEDDSDYNMTCANSKDGFRRKHHRPWSLSEVIKLVDGVSMFGAGRWSEIKKLSFSAFSYRTSVDLKDKWRNLLRASFAQISSDNTVKKHGSVPIPAPILLRVRQLAETHSQPLPVPRLSASKVPPVCYSGRSVNETRSTGFL
ncbi:hypothetical protein ACHQM5_001700 [Ranunculus cassubicifolius]